MAASLIEESEVFAESIGRCGKVLDGLVEWGLEDALADAELLRRVDVVQPASFAVMVSLAALWRSFGVEPAWVVGHSQGEVAAVCVAGGLSLEDAARVVVARSRAVAEELSGGGGMASVGLAGEELEHRLAGFEDRVEVAAVNSPASSVVSGEVAALDELVADCESDGVWARRIAVDYPSHSAAVEPVRERLVSELAGIRPRSSEVPFFSTVTASPIDTAELDGAYWYRSLRERVRFDDATRGLVAAGVDVFLEVSSHPVLTVAMSQSVEAARADGRVAILDSLRRSEGGAERFCTALVAAHVNGVDVDWSPWFEGSGGKLVDLPTYPFERRRFWLDGAGSAGDMSAAGLAAGGHRLLAAAVELAGADEWVFSGQLSLSRLEWLADHRVDGRVVVPAALLCELAIAAGRQRGCTEIEELTFVAPLVLENEHAIAIQLRVGAPGADGTRTLEIHARSGEGRETGNGWVCHASGRLAPVALESPAADQPSSLPPEGAEAVDVDALYDRLADSGLDYGPAFQGLTAAWDHAGGLLGEVELDPDQGAEASDFALHPALLDAALHGFYRLSGRNGNGSAPRAELPFALRGLRVLAAGRTRLRVWLTSPAPGRLSLSGYDEDGELALQLDELDFRPLGKIAEPHDSLYQVVWQPRDLAPAERPADHRRLGPLARPRETIERALALEPIPEVLVVDAARPDGEDLAQVTHRATEATLALLQAWLAEERLGESRLVLLTRGAVAPQPGEVPAPAAAAVRGLVASAASEHPGRFALLDLEPEASLEQVDWAGVVGCDEPELALRGEALLAPRLIAAGSGDWLAPPAEGDWNLAIHRAGSLDGVGLSPCEAGTQELEQGEVRLAVRAGGLNFRDVLIALGEYPGEAPLGSEVAGVVTELGPGVDGLQLGDRVMGLAPDSLGPAVVADSRLLVTVPEEWSFERAASVPVAFLTAWHGLVELAELKAGERVLVHSAAGGVGMAAVAIANWLGAEVFATASEPKWGVVEKLGVAAERIASSRDLGFRERFLAATGGEGVDVVLDALAGEFVDASLELLPRGGRFVEMGKADVRDAAQVAAAHPGVEYEAFDLMGVDPAQIGRMLARLAELLESGELGPLPPLEVFDVRDARSALRKLREAQHVGKLVLSVPRVLDPEGTVLITGGTGGLGAQVARHLARSGARRLLLVSRSGGGDAGAGLVSELESLGCEAQLAAADVADRGQLAAVLAQIPEQAPLSAVIHAAGALADAPVEGLEREQLRRALAPKVDGAWNLHELTAELDLAEFVVFSSVAGLLGAPGQANYAAANRFMDALCSARRAAGLAGTSLAWGLWAEQSGMTGHLGEVDLQRLARQGIAPLETEQGLELFDRARAVGAPLTVPARFELGALREGARAGLLPPLLSSLVRGARRERAGAGSLASQLAAVPAEERQRRCLELVLEQAAAVLGHDSPAAIDPELPFKELGFDSLGAVELRNRLGQLSGLRLTSTLIFDHPTPAAVASLLERKLAADGDGRSNGASPAGEEGEIRRLLASLPIARLRQAGLLDELVALASQDPAEAAQSEDDAPAEIDEMDVESLVELTFESGAAPGDSEEGGR